jgi:tetratricopeptide (TPR) repeat protein
MGLDSKPSRALAVALANLVQKHGKQGLKVVAIAGDPAEQLKEFSEQQKLGFPVAADTGRQTLAKYGADQIVPITYLVGPGGKIAEVISGGGAGAQQVLLAIAEKEYARGNNGTAAELFDQVAKEDPKNAIARGGAAFTLVKQGKLERAEEEFKTLSALGPDGARVSAEGLAEVALRKGDLDAALARAPQDSGYGAVIRGEVAARRGELDEARKEFRTASARPFDFNWQKAVSFNNLARVTKDTGDSKEAIENYDKAIAVEPFSVEARSNKGVALEKAGKRDEAKKTLAAAKAMAPSDQLVATLLRRLEDQEKQKVDLERQKFVNQLVSELVTAYKSGKAPPKPADDWAPRALVVSLIDVQDRLALSRDGLSEAFVLNVTRRLQETGRVKVVEREIIDKLLSELKLGSSELADPATRLKLGRVLAASVIGTGGFFPANGKAELQMRLIDTETTDIRTTLSEALANPAEVESFSTKVADKIAKTLQSAYPLKGKIATVDTDEIVIGIGQKHGARAGLHFNVVADGEPVEVDGEVLGYKQKKVGRLEVLRVEDGFAYAKPVSGSGFEKGQHLVEAEIP